MKSILAVLDKDKDYAANLAAYANEKGLTPFSVIAFSDIESLKNFSLRQPVDVLLNGTDKPDEDMKSVKAEQVIRLAEDAGRRFAHGRGGAGKERDASVYKYQAADRLFGEVMECYRDKKGMFSDKAMKSEIIGVSSPVGRCGKTGFAITMGRVLAENCKVMYLNLEECSGLSALTGVVYRHSLTDLIYALRQGGLDESVLGSAIYQLGKLDYVAPVSCAEDMAEIKAGELADLTGRLAAEGHYEVLILDTGNLGKDAFPLLERCGIIYAPMTDDAVSQAKMAEWKTQLQSYGGDELTEQVRILHLPQSADIAGPEEYFDNLLYGGVGRMVRDLLREDERGR